MRVDISILNGRTQAYMKGRKHGHSGLYNACPYPAGSSYSAAYLDGFHDGRHDNE